MSRKKTPEVIEDSKLDDASGGIGMLLPAVQKVRDAASSVDTTTTTISADQIGLTSKLGDGSV